MTLNHFVDVHHLAQSYATPAPILAANGGELRQGDFEATLKGDSYPFKSNMLEILAADISNN